MSIKIYTSDLTWRSKEYQLNVIYSTLHREGFVGEAKTYEGGGDLEIMLRPTSRKGKHEIVVSSLSVIARYETDFKSILKRIWRTGSTLRGIEEICFLFPGCVSMSSAVDQWKKARRTGAAKQGGIKSAGKRKANSAAAIAQIAARWPLPSKEWPTKALLKEAGVSLNTAKSVLGKRPIAQYNYQAKMKRKAKREGK